MVRPDLFKKKEHTGGMVQNMIRNNNTSKSNMAVPEPQKQRPGQGGKK